MENYPYSSETGPVMKVLSMVQVKNVGGAMAPSFPPVVQSCKYIPARAQYSSAKLVILLDTDGRGNSLERCSSSLPPSVRESRREGDCWLPKNTADEGK